MLGVGRAGRAALVAVPAGGEGHGPAHFQHRRGLQPVTQPRLRLRPGVPVREQLHRRCRGQPLGGTGLSGPVNAEGSLQMFWFALMPWKLREFRVASDEPVGPFCFGWLPASPTNFEPMIRLSVPASRLPTCLTRTPATSFLRVFTAGSWVAELYSMTESL